MKFTLILSILFALFASPVISHETPVPDFDLSLEMVLDNDAVASHDNKAATTPLYHEANMEEMTKLGIVNPGAFDVLKLPDSRPEASRYFHRTIMRSLIGFYGVEVASSGFT